VCPAPPYLFSWLWPFQKMSANDAVDGSPPGI
jgi:hypothetical protein